MRARLRSLELLMPFATAGELIAHKRQPLVSVPPSATALAALREMEEDDIAFLPSRRHGPDARAGYRDIFAITLVKTAAVAVAIGVFYLTGLY